MLRKFAAVLLATTLIAGPAFAAQGSGAASSNPAPMTAAAPATAKVPSVLNKTHRAKASKLVKHVRRHARIRVARGKAGTIKVARHLTVTKTHRGHVAHVKPSKPAKSAKTAA